MIKRIAVNFFLGYAACSAAISLIPIQEEVISVTVFDSDNGELTTHHKYEVRKSPGLPFTNQHN